MLYRNLYNLHFLFNFTIICKKNNLTYLIIGNMGCSDTFNIFEKNLYEQKITGKDLN